MSHLQPVKSFQWMIDVGVNSADVEWLARMDGSSDLHMPAGRKHLHLCAGRPAVQRLAGQALHPCSAELTGTRRFTR
jgi:hypothetical protein